MTVTIELRPELFAELTTAAQECSLQTRVSPTQVATEVVEAYLAGRRLPRFATRPQEVPNTGRPSDVIEHRIATPKLRSSLL